MKLRLLYGERLRADPQAERRKMKLLFIVGLAVYPLFLWITYVLSLGRGPVHLILIGLLAGLACVPIVLIAYGVGIGRPWRKVWGERPREMKALALKIGFFYGLEMYWLILGVVEFLFGYHTFRAALISFVALAVARDGFEIGYLRAREEAAPPRTIFPDGRPIGEFLKSDARPALLWVGAATLLGGAAGAAAGPFLPNPRIQILLVGSLAGGIATFGYLFAFSRRPTPSESVRFFIWPAFVMACSYFFISAYLLRILFQIPLSPAADLAFLTALCSGWIMKDTLFLGYLKADLGSRISDGGLTP